MVETVGLGGVRFVWGKIVGMGNMPMRVPGLGESQPGAGGESLDMDKCWQKCIRIAQAASNLDKHPQNCSSIAKIGGATLKNG